MPRWSLTYAIVFVVGSLASAADEQPVGAPAPIAAAFGVVLGEPLAAAAALDCERRPAPALDRCVIAPPPRESDIAELVALTDTDGRVLAVEAASHPLSLPSCERVRTRMLARFERDHGKALEAAFDAWGFRGDLWEQDIDHPWSVRGLSLSRCARAAEDSLWRFEVAFGAAQPDPGAERAVPSAR